MKTDCRNVASKFRSPLREHQKVLAVVCDIRNSTQVKAAVAEVCEKLTVIDVLVNAAGIWIGRAVHETSDEELDNLLNTNLKAPLYFCREVVPQMLQSGGGAIINISSIGGFVAMEGRVPHTWPPKQASRALPVL